MQVLRAAPVAVLAAVLLAGPAGPVTQAAEEYDNVVRNATTDQTVFVVFNSGGAGNVAKAVEFDGKAAEVKGYVLKPNETCSFKSGFGDQNTYRVYAWADKPNLGKPVAQERFGTPKIKGGNPLELINQAASGRKIAYKDGKLVAED